MPKSAEVSGFRNRKFLSDGAVFTGQYDIPCVRSNPMALPEKIITFSKSLKSKDFDAWVVFYEDDSQFERVWRSPRRYVEVFKRFKGIVAPDFSLNGDMPLCEQIYNVYRSRLLAHYYQSVGIPVIVNARWGIDLTFDFCFDGLYDNDVVFVGTHGSLKEKENRVQFTRGLDELIDRVHPKVICVYGFVPDDVFALLKMQGVEIIGYESEFSSTHRKEVADGIQA